MKKPDIPLDEQARLETLRSLNILDSQPEERFDRLTRMAKRIFGVPVALVSLVDKDRQWFKSCAGLDASETSRDISFCGHAINGRDVFIIPDALADQRFADNPLVVGDPNIRFYAGCPLCLNGYRLGTLCLIDTVPRNFDKEDVDILRDLAFMVERELAVVQLATLDELTNILNRRGFLVLARHSLNLCARQNIPAALVFMDLDKFKPINDKFGHAEGDRALMAFAEQIKNCFRESDVFARLSGDEFVVLLANTSQQETVELVGRLHKLLDNYNCEAGRGYSITFSYGIVEFDPETHPTIEELLASGDAVMYALKKAKP